jgi:capsular exopolysaccharide synthesis family protein
VLPDTSFEGQILGLRDYLNILRTRKWLIFATMLVVVGAALFWTFRQTPIYESTARVLVKNPTPPGGVSQESDINLETEAQLAASDPVADLAADALGEAKGTSRFLLSGLNVQIAQATSSFVPPDILIFRYRDQSPNVSQERANAFSEAYLRFRYQQVVDNLEASAAATTEQINDLQKQLADIQRQIERSLDSAQSAALQAQANTLGTQLGVLRQQLAQLTPPDRGQVGSILQPASPAFSAGRDLLRSGIVGILLGLALGVGIAFLRERLDDRLRGRTDLERHTGATVLASVPRIRDWKDGDRSFLVTLADPGSPATEAYRTLRISVAFAASQRDLKSIIVTSPEAGEGKTTTTANLAVAFSQAGKTVVVVSADLRKPRLESFFDLPAGKPGLTNFLAGEITLDQALQRPRHIPNLRVLGSGPIPGNPAELLSSTAVAHILDELAARADLTLIDAPPILAVSDALALSRSADGFLLVADASKTNRTAVDHTCYQLRQVNGRLIGAVLNRVGRANSLTTANYYGTYPTQENGSGTGRLDDRTRKFSIIRR